jgi:hypothetical protein
MFRKISNNLEYADKDLMAFIDTGIGALTHRPRASVA